jgi:MoxR-like ATPase
VDVMPMNVSEVGALAARIRAEIGKAVVGQDEAVNLLLIALFAGGHVLLEGPPGTAKTLLAQSFARSVALDYGRIQFTPDLMPGDVIGANLFNFQTSTFTLTRGPVFCELLLADEINRTPPKTQAALLEAMQERHITIDGISHPLSPRFTVVATQNPIEQQGTYPLPEAQLDRFLFKHVLTIPRGAGAGDHRRPRRAHRPDGPRRLWRRPGAGTGGDRRRRRYGGPCAADGRGGRLHRRSGPGHARVRRHRDRRLAARRAMLAVAARARAALDGRDYVVPDDVKRLAVPALRHRLMLSAAAEIEGRKVDLVLKGLVERVAAPR